MKTRSAVLITFVFLFGTLLAPAQQSPPAYIIGVDFVDPSPDCPVFIAHVVAGGPADKAGLKPGDAIVSIDGVTIQTLADMRKLSSDKPKPVRVEVMRADGKHAYDVGREPYADALARQGRKLAHQGYVVPADMTDAEIERLINFDPARVIGSVFTGSYPTDPATYYPGFELLLLQSPDELMVAGMEDGPATHAGIHWGDIVLAVNGKDVKGLPAEQLERLFSSAAPAKMKLRVRRLDQEREFEFPLWKGADVLHVNQKQSVQGHIVPMGIPEKDVHCFVESKSE